MSSNCVILVNPNSSIDMKTKHTHVIATLHWKWRCLLLTRKDNNKPANQELGDLKLLEGNTVNIFCKSSYMLVLVPCGNLNYLWQ